MHARNGIQVPLYRTIAEVGALWLAADAGYRIVFPLLNIDLSYNAAPFANAAYFALWLAVGIATFWSLFRHLHVEKRLWAYAFICIGFASVAWILLTYVAKNIIIGGPEMTPYTDILFATPWYFLPKSFEILVQQTLIAALVLALYSHFKSLRKVSILYAIIFGGTHVLIFILKSAPTPYAAVMTAGALLSAAVFPYLILRVPSGFVYAYIIHLLYYALFVLISHTWPPPGYG